MRVDDWHWLRDRDDPAVIAYLEAENGYTDAMTAASAGLRERLYEQIKARIQEDDLSAPARHGRLVVLEPDRGGKPVPGPLPPGGPGAHARRLHGTGRGCHRSGRSDP